MNTKLVISLVFFCCLAGSMADIGVMTTYNATDCPDSGLIGRFTVIGLECPKKRQTGGNVCTPLPDAEGLFYKFDSDLCTAMEAPAPLAGFVSITSYLSPNCTGVSSRFEVRSTNVNYTLASVVLGYGFMASEASVSCNNDVANIRYCLGLSGVFCFSFDVPANQCYRDGEELSVSQNACGSAPVAPVSAPVTAPVSGPRSSPVASPIRASSASILAGSALALVSLLL